MAYQLCIKNSATDKGVKFEVNKPLQLYSDWKFSLISLKYDKGIYRPCCIEAQLMMSLGTSGNGKVMPDTDKFNDIFSLKTVDLAYIQGDNTDYIAKNYFVFDVIPEFRNSSTTTVYITLIIYSPDKFLTLDKFCQTFVAQKLGAEIFTNFLNRPSPADNSSHINNFKDKGCIFEVKLQHLCYKLGETSYELIQPYLVQYNESFYDFIARTANRYGEFLYYEDGSLILGLKDKTADPVTTFSSITYHRSAHNDKYDSDYAWRRNYVNGEDGVEYSGNGERYNYEGLAFEYLEHTNRITGSTYWENEALYPNKFYTNAISAALGKSTLAEIIASAGVGMSLAAIKANELAASLNSTYNDDHIDNITKEDQKSYVNPKNNKKEDDVCEVSEFSSMAGKEKLSLVYFTDIDKYEHKAEEGGIHIKFKDTRGWEKLLLGTPIKVNGKTYIVTSVKGSMHPTDGDFSIGYTESVEVDAVLHDKDKAYPFPLSECTIRKCDPQIAYIADNNDPMRIGRVRIRYPWQKSDDTASPWIRISRPMATKNGGVDFKLFKGDEVIVDYENGNIERPFVVGSLHSPNREPAGTSYKGSHHTITSANGHTIHFSDPGSGQAYLNGIIPAIGVLKSYCPFQSSTIPEWGNFFPKELGGGIDMYDTYGMYSLSMSSDKRAVEIKSPWGNVSINALTGITLSAPNGDIKIEGKNVSIQAGNTLKLESGTNIKKPFLAKGFGSGILDVAKETGLTLANETLGKMVDLKLIRTVLEIFIRPAGGTMLIKSNRFMHLEAGKGKVKSGIDFYGAKKRNVEETELNVLKLFSAIQFITQCRDLIMPLLKYYSDSCRALRINKITYDNLKRIFIAFSKNRIKTEGLPDSDLLIDNALKNEDFPKDKFKDVSNKIETFKGAYVSYRLMQECFKKLCEYAKNLYDYAKTSKKHMKDKWDGLKIDTMKVQTKALLLGIDSTIPTQLTTAFSKIKTEMKSVENGHLFLEDKEQIMAKYTYDECEISCRHFVYMALKELNSIQIIKLPNENFNDNVYKDGNWQDFVNGIEMCTEPVVLTLKEKALAKIDKITSNSFMKIVNDKSGFKGFLDQYQWNPEQKGEIFFSDKDGKRTISFGDEAQLKSVLSEVGEPALQELKDLLNS